MVICQLFQEEAMSTTDPRGRFFWLHQAANCVKLNNGDINMPRTARERSNTGIYHIILRGINRQAIFEDEEDSAEFLRSIIKYQVVDICCRIAIKANPLKTISTFWQP